MRILRHPLLLVVLTLGQALVMQAVEFLYFRRLTDGIGQLDYRPSGFSVEQALDWITALGPHGRAAVLVWHYLTFDLLFPALFSLTLASLVYVSSRDVPAFSRLTPRTRSIAALVFVLPYAIVDYVQNLIVAGMLSDPTAVDETTVAVASAFNVAKFLFAALGLAAVAVMYRIGRRGERT